MTLKGFFDILHFGGARFCLSRCLVDEWESHGNGGAVYLRAAALQQDTEQFPGFSS